MPVSKRTRESQHVFVFGSNRQGRHGGGSARHALEHHGAIYGQAEGRQGNSYAIITKELRRGYPPVRLPEVRSGVERFLVYAGLNRDTQFTVVAIGCMLAGFRPEEIAPLFASAPDNVQLPKEFTDILERGGQVS